MLKRIDSAKKLDSASRKATVYMTKIAVETKVIEEIPVLMCIPDSSKPCPIVFYIPGFTAHKHYGLSLAYLLAQKGIACISIDSLYHGERYDARIVDGAQPQYGGIYPRDSGLDIFMIFMRVVEQSSQDVRTLLNALVDDTRIDMNRAGVTGMSMGAWTTFLAFAMIPKLKVAVPMMGIPTFTQRWLDLLDECAWSNPEWKQALSQLTDKTNAHTEYIKHLDPAIALQQCAPRSLLIMNGDFDNDMMKTYTLNWYREAKIAWQAHPHDLRWKVYPVGHTITHQMEHDTVFWFAKHFMS